MKSWMDGVAAGRPYIWQQDRAPPTPPRNRTGAGTTSLSSGKRRFGLLAHCTVIRWTILYGAWLRKTPIGPPQHRRVPDHLRQGYLQQLPQGGPQEGLQLVPVEAGGGWGRFHLLNESYVPIWINLNNYIMLIFFSVSLLFYFFKLKKIGCHFSSHPVHLCSVFLQISCIWICLEIFKLTWRNLVITSVLYTAVPGTLNGYQIQKNFTLLIQLKSCLLLIDKFNKIALLHTLSLKKKILKATFEAMLHNCTHK